MLNISTGLRLTLTLLVGVLGYFLPRTFLTLDEITVYSDGYANQVFYVLTVLQSGGDMFQESPLFFIHLVRTGVALFFQAINAMGGPVLEVLVLSLLVWPVLDLFVGSARRRLGLVLFFLVFVLSFRSVLVSISIGYLLLFQLRRPKWRYLLASFVFGSLSSGAVLLCAILVLREGRHLFARGAAYVTYLVLVLVSLAISGADKLAGFNSGDAGYEATVGNSTGLLAAVSRNTILVSFMNGDYARGAVYSAILVFVLAFAVHSYFTPKAAWYRVILVAGIPVMMLEGLGTVALLVPLLMLAAGVFIQPAPQAALRPHYGR